MGRMVHVDVGKTKKWTIVGLDSVMFLYLVLAHQIHFICLVILLGEMVPSSTVEAEKVRYTCGL